MEYAELKKKSETELKDMATAGRKELFNLRMTRTPEMKDTSTFAKTRKNIARMMTAINAKKEKK